MEIRAEYLTGYLFMIAFMALLHALFLGTFRASSSADQRTARWAC